MTTTTISDLPGDLVEEVLSRVPVTSLRAVRFTCTKWNTLSKRQSFTKKQIAQAKAKKKQTDEFLVIKMMNSKAYLMSINLHGIQNLNDESFLQHKGTLISLTDADDRVLNYKVLHCDGLLLCIKRDYTRLVVWNPYCLQTRWIEPRNAYHHMDNYALGYEMKKKKNESHHRCHNILRYLDAYEKSVDQRIYESEIYDFDSNSWKVVEVPRDLTIHFFQGGVSLKGNTYWTARENIPPIDGGDNIQQGVGEIEEEEEEEEETPGFLICFDFTTERFGPRLPLPFHYGCQDTVILSSVREEQLAVLFQHWISFGTGIWISNKIERNAVSWSKLFLEFRVKEIESTNASFFVDQKNKVAVVFLVNIVVRFDKGQPTCIAIGNTAWIIGEDGYTKQVDLKEYVPFSIGCSYVPSPVQINQSALQGKRKRDQIY